MNLCSLCTSSWRRLDVKAAISIRRQLLTVKVSSASRSLTNHLTVQLCSHRLATFSCRRAVPLPCVFGGHVNQSHIPLRGLSQYTGCTTSYILRQRQAADQQRSSPLTRETKLPPRLTSVRNLQTSTPTHTSLSLTDPDCRDFALDTLKRYREAQDKLTRGDITEKERKIAGTVVSGLSSAAGKIQEWESIRNDIHALRQLGEDEKDPEMKKLADQELAEYNERLDAVEYEVLRLISPRDVHDDNDVIVECTAGIGGQEAMLFTADIFNMYQKFATHMKWSFQILDFDTTDIGGVRHSTASVKGHQAYKRFKFEAGVHRVQRIPKTEKSGRVHTSTMTVAVLPQPKQIDIKLESKDLRIETKKASGAGGQHVNTTDSAVRIVHLPTGIIAECQQERSQMKNKQIALQILQTKIYSQRLEQQTKAEENLRKQQVGSSARSEKIRTYNFVQDRITDHRIGASVHGMDAFLSGGEMLEEMTDRLVDQQAEELLRFEVEKFVETRRRETP